MTVGLTVTRSALAGELHSGYGQARGIKSDSTLCPGLSGQSGPSLTRSSAVVAHNGSAALETAQPGEAVGLGAWQPEAAARLPAEPHNFKALPWSLSLPPPDGLAWAGDYLTPAEAAGTTVTLNPRLCGQLRTVESASFGESQW